MEVSLWIMIVSDVACAIIGGIFGILGKTYSIKRRDKKIMKQKAGDDSTQVQIGGDYHEK